MRELCQAGEMQRAVAAALALYGREILGFLAATSDKNDAVAEINAEVGQVVCEELARFEWRASLRTWMYTLARHARHRQRVRRRREEALRVPLSQAPEPAAAPPTSKPLHRRTTMKERLAEARARLGADERELLVLRVDRELSWSEIAVILEEVPRDAPAAAQTRASAALRKRFERTLAKLRQAFAEMSASARP